MQNHMRETLDAGMADLQAHKGSGLPAPPPSAATAPVAAKFAEIAPPPDPAAAQEITQQYQEADKAEQDAFGGGSGAEAFTPATPAPTPPATISLGQTTDEVIGILGQPKNILDLGAKKIYVYPDLKITFKEGKVTDIE
jgi:hypothetical protein